MGGGEVGGGGGNVDLFEEIFMCIHNSKVKFKSLVNIIP